MAFKATTAERIFYILHILNKGPCGVSQLNNALLAKRFIKKPLSDDTLCLYINTLRELGCIIDRPKLSNHFQYTLTHHPFGSRLNHSDLSVLQRIKPLAEQWFNVEEMLQLDMLFKRFFEHTCEDTSENLLASWFTTTRSVDYQQHVSILSQLKTAVQESQVLKITYGRIPLSKDEPTTAPLTLFYFCPRAIRYQSGIIYVAGLRMGFDSLSVLRLERIQGLTIASPEAINLSRTDLHRRIASLETDIIIRFPHQTLDTFEPLNLDETIATEIDSSGDPALIVTIHTGEFFFVKQWLLEQGSPFYIDAPDWFRDDVIQTLRQTAAQYAPAPEQSDEKMAAL